MNSEKGFGRAKGGFLRAAAGVAAFAVTILVVVAVWAGWAMAASKSSAPVASPAQSAAAGGSLSLASLVLTVGGVLVAVMITALTVDYGRRRIARRRTGGRRGGTHAKTSGPRADGAIKAAMPPGSEDGYPSWPGPPGPYALHPDHPSWPGGPDPRWAATQSILREDDYPSWPEPQDPPWLDAASPSRDPHGRPAARPEWTLPVRMRRDFVLRASRTAGTSLAPKGPGQPDGPGAHEHSAVDIKP
jgi:hypothetical protein